MQCTIFRNAIQVFLSAISKQYSNVKVMLKGSSVSGYTWRKKSRPRLITKSNPPKDLDFSAVSQTFKIESKKVPEIEHLIEELNKTMENEGISPSWMFFVSMEGWNSGQDYIIYSLNQQNELVAEFNRGFDPPQDREGWIAYFSKITNQINTDNKHDKIHAKKPESGKCAESNAAASVVKSLESEKKERLIKTWNDTSTFPPLSN
jgi:hypothetical protein